MAQADGEQTSKDYLSILQGMLNTAPWSWEESEQEAVRWAYEKLAALEQPAAAIQTKSLFGFPIKLDPTVPPGTVILAPDAATVERLRAQFIGTHNRNPSADEMLKLLAPYTAMMTNLR